MDTAEHPGLASAVMSRIGVGMTGRHDDQVAVEAPIAFLYNCDSHAVMMASPRDLEDFAYGFTLSEGIVGGIDEIEQVRATEKGPGFSLSIDIPENRHQALGSRKRNLEGRTGCGLCGIAEIDQALRPLSTLATTNKTVSAAAIDRAVSELPNAQELNQQTGAVHAAAFADNDGKLICVREDVGRHNALDKLIGAVARRRLDPTDGFVVVTSRCSMEMVQKTVTFGCPVLVAVSAPTSLALELAEHCNLSVAAFARGMGFNLYTHAERIA